MIRRFKNFYGPDVQDVFEDTVNGYVYDIPITDWTTWKQRYKRQLAHVANFEEQFVDLVLSQIDTITPWDVVPQYHFIDDDNNHRYIDYMIINEDSNYCLPIELDGYAKMVGTGSQYHVFNDFLERQNSIINQFGLVLRFSNKKMLNQTNQVIDQIKHTLACQYDNKSTEAVQQQQTQQLIDDYEQQLQTLKQQDNTQQIDNLVSILKSEINELRTELHDSKSKPVQQTIVVEETQSGWENYFIAGVIVSALGLVFLALYVVKTKDTPVSTPVEVATVYTPVTVPEEPKPESVTTVTNTFKHPEPTEVKPISKPTPKPVTQYKVGTYGEVCGKVVQIKDFSAGSYLNLNYKYPNQDISITVWGGKYPYVKKFYNKQICVTGTIEEYKGKPQVEVRGTTGIKLQF